MAVITPYRISLLAQDYPTKYDGLLTFLEPYLTELENARGGQASLLANLNYNFAQFIVASSGLTVDLNTNGKRIYGGVAPVADNEFVIKTYADGLAFASALPAISSANMGKEITNDGTTAYWGISAFSALGVLNSIGY